MSTTASNLRPGDVIVYANGTHDYVYEVWDDDPDGVWVESIYLEGYVDRDRRFTVLR